MGKRGKVGENKLPIASASVMPTMANAAQEDMKYKAEDALRDIQRAETHRRDAKLMEHVKKLGREKMEALKRVCK